MVRSAFYILIGAALWVSPVQAKDAHLPDVRAVEHHDIDVFAVLQAKAAADIALDNREFSRALEGYETAYFYDSDLRGVRRGLRHALMGLGQWSQAANYISDENSADAAIIAFMQGGDISQIKQAVDRHANDARLWNILGQTQDAAGDYFAARQSYAMADMAGQRAGLMQNNIGHSHWVAGEKHLALRAFQRAAAQDPTDPQFDNNRRRALIATDQIEQAVARLDSDKASIFLAQAGRQAAENGDIKLAQLLLRKSMVLSPRHQPKIAAELKRLESVRQ